MMKQICTAFLLAFVGLSGVAQESAAPRVAIPLIASGSHHRPISVTAESLAITDQKTTVTGASLVRGASTRRILVLISDGEDNLSHITRDEAASEALRAGAVIFTMDTELSGMSLKGEKVMENFAKLTGGESFSQVGRNDLPKVFASIKEMMDGMYYLRYVPPDASKIAVHEVDVKPAPKEKFKLSYARKYLWNQ